MDNKNYSNIIVKIDDRYCEWEFGFSVNNKSINDFIKAIEEKFKIERDYGKILNEKNG